MRELTPENPEERLSETALRAQLHRLQRENAKLWAENTRLRSSNRELRATADAYVRRVQAASLFGPVELTAGTSIGPLRQRGRGGRGSGLDRGPRSGLAAGSRPGFDRSRSA